MMFNFLSVCFIVIFSVTETYTKPLDDYTLEQFNYTITFGDEGSCNCPHFQNFTTYYPLVAEGGNNTLKHIFRNPLMDGYLIKNIDITLYATYHCDFVTIKISLVISQYIISEFEIFPENVTCYPDSCKTCSSAVSLPVQKPPSEWWLSGFNYQGNNEVQLYINEGSMQMNAMVLTFYALNLNPAVMFIAPPLCPIKINKTIEVFANNIFPGLFPYLCDFRGSKNSTSSGNAEGYSNLVCTLPAYSNQELIHVWIYPEVGLFTNLKFKINSTGPFQYFIYDEPKVKLVSPTIGPDTGGTIVGIKGEKFFNNYLATPSCRFGNTIPVNALFYNSTYITCISPPSATDGDITLYITENRVDWLNVTNFVYKVPVVQWSLLQPRPFTWVIYFSGIGLGILIIFGMVFIGYQRNLRKGYEDLSISPLAPEYMIDYSDIKIKELIGHGSFGNVFRGTWIHTEVAVKRIHQPTDALIKELYKEAEIMIGLRHPNIVTFMACTLKPEVCLITEFVEHGSLYGILHDSNIIVELEHVRKMASDACKGMAYLHGARVIHRDLKSHNLLVDKAWVVKVADFGLSRAIDDINSKTMTACGTPCWTAPEVIRNQRYTVKADVYSFGICLWEMLSRADPYPGMPPYQVVINVASNNLRPNVDLSWNPELRDILEISWDEEPDKRPTFGKLVDLLESISLPQDHPFPYHKDGLDLSFKRSTKH